MNMRVSLNIAVICATVLILAVIGAVTWIAVVHDGSVAEIVIVALVSVVSAFATNISSIGQAIVHSLGGPAPKPAPAPAPADPPVTVTP